MNLKDKAKIVSSVRKSPWTTPSPANNKLNGHVALHDTVAICNIKNIIAEK